MAYQIERRDGYFEVHLSGETSKYEVLKAIREMERQDPGKSLADIWIIDGNSQVPLEHFADIAQAAKGLFPAGRKGNKSALVAADSFHQAQLELYRAEGAELPIDIRVFLSYDEALEWIKAPSDDELPPADRGRK